MASLPVQVKFQLAWSLALTVVFVGAQITVLAVLGNGNYIVQVSFPHCTLYSECVCQCCGLELHRCLLALCMLRLDVLCRSRADLTGWIP